MNQELLTEAMSFAKDILNIQSILKSSLASKSWRKQIDMADKALSIFWSTAEIGLD